MSVLNVTELKNWLNITGPVTTDLQTVLDAAETKVEQRVGPLERKPVTERLESYGSALVLSYGPDPVLVSVTPDAGPALDTTLMVVDNGVLTYKAYAGRTTSPYGGPFGGWYAVTYQAGFATIPPDLKLAVFELARYFWRPKRGGGNRPGPKPAEATAPTVPGAAFIMPFQIQELLVDYTLPGFA